MLGSKELHPIVRNLIQNSTISVVGSSGNLRGRAHGAAIDASTLVVRVNAPPRFGYEEDAGARPADLRVAWEVGVKDALQRAIMTPAESLVLTCPYSTTCNWPQWAHLLDDNIRSRAALHPAWPERLHRVVLRDAGIYPSTGFIAIALAVAIAQVRNLTAPPSVFGFGACPTCGKYYDCGIGGHGNGSSMKDVLERRPQATGSDGIHPYETEQKVREHWHRQGLIHLVHDVCEPGVLAKGRSAPNHGLAVRSAHSEPSLRQNSSTRQVLHSAVDLWATHAESRASAAYAGASRHKGRAYEYAKSMVANLTSHDASRSCASQSCESAALWLQHWVRTQSQPQPTPSTFRSRPL